MALPALNHISKLSAGRGRSDAILVWLRAAGPHSTIYRSRAREVTIRTQSGYIRSASLAAPAINRSGCGSCAAYIALLYERPPYSESSASLRATVCGTAAPSLIPHSEFRIPHPPKAAFPIFSYCVPLNFAHSHKKTAARNSDYKSRSAVTFHQSCLCTFCIHHAFYAFARHFVAKYPCLLTAAL